MGDAVKSVLFDVERLQQLSYERSRKWAKFLDSINVSEAEDLLNVNEFENVYDDQPDDQEELASMEDENCDDKCLDIDVLRDITNTTRLTLLLSCHNKTSRLSESTMVQGEDPELHDLFNQTLPVIHEHNRQMRESGFDHILNTFDAEKIEDKVGGWLRRHNTLCAADYKPPEFVVNQKENPYHSQHQTATWHANATKPYRSYRNEDTDSDDSFHSGETARYIRSSRAGGLKNSPSTTMMIKTYRMFKGTRQALKEKYACAQDDDAEVHLNKLQHRRRIANNVEILHSYEKHSLRAHKLKDPYTTPRRRKVLRKRSGSISCSAKDTSSESDNDYGRGTAEKNYYRGHTYCAMQRPQLTRRLYEGLSSDVPGSTRRRQYRAKTRTSSRKFQMYYYEQTHSNSMSSTSPLSSSPSFTTKTRITSDRKCVDKRKYNDVRPYKTDAKCRCYNDKWGCQKHHHSADTPAQKWLVENNYTPNKLPPSEQTLRVNNVSSISGIEAITEDASILSNKNQESSTVFDNSTKKRSKTIMKSTKKNNKEEDLDETFEKELQIALKASKELYEKEQEAKKSKNNKETIFKKHKSLPSKPLSKTPCKESSEVCRRHLKRTLNEDANLAAQKSCKKEKNTIVRQHSTNTITGSDDTFFSVTTGVYNSTALPNDKSAYQRQIDGDTDITPGRRLESKKKRMVTNEIEVLNHTLLTYGGEQGDKGTTNISKDYVNHKSVKDRKKESFKDKNSTEVTPRIDISTKNIHTEEFSNTNEHVFVKPIGQPKKSKKIKSIIETKSETTCFSQSQAVGNSAAVVFNDNPELEGEAIKRNEYSHDGKQTLEDSYQKKQENITLPAAEDNKAAKGKIDIGNCSVSGELNELKNSYINKSTADKSIENINPSENTFTNQQKAVLLKTPSTSRAEHAYAHESSIEISRKDDRQKHSISHKTLDDSTCTRAPQNKPKSINKNGVTKKKNSTTIKTNNLNITSTTANSPDASTYLRPTKKSFKRIITADSSCSASEDDENDCTVVSSTTNIESYIPFTDTHMEAETASTSRQSNLSLSSTTSSKSNHVSSCSASTTQRHSAKGIIIYTPKKPSLASNQSLNNDSDFFNITKEHLSCVLGEKSAEKFLKYHIGRRRFNKNSTIYFLPPATRVLDTNNALSSDSDDDDLDSMGQYGDLYESFGYDDGNRNNGSEDNDS